MASSSAAVQPERRTAADEIFDRLHADIVTLRLLPGTKVSESEIAKQSGVSRQPVREAFIHLNRMGLLKISPQKATVVRKISIRDILNAQFIRTAVEIEVIRKACDTVTESDFELFDINLESQKKAANKNNATGFHTLDYDFHHLICNAADSEFAFSTIAENKSQVDRLCMIYLADKKSMIELIDDHSQIYDALRRRDMQSMVELTRSHLSRLNANLKIACKEHSEYFED